MLGEVMEGLDLKPGDRAIDGTLGGGGYTEALAKAVGPQGEVIAIDLDENAIKNAEEKFKQNKKIKIVHDNFKNLSQIIERVLGKSTVCQFAGIVFDLGLSSAQLEDRNRGFSFQSDNPLDMAFGQIDPDATSTQEIVNQWSKEELAKIFIDYSEEKWAVRIADRICRSRADVPVTTTGKLAEIVTSAIPARFRANSKIHPATRVFQALRMATNHELENIKQALSQALGALKPGGRIAVVSFHSLEDRLVKDFFSKNQKGCTCPPRFPICQCGFVPKLKIITKRPILPANKEIVQNPRSRSAKLRLAEKI